MRFKTLKAYSPAYIVLFTLLLFTFYAFYQSQVAEAEERENLLRERVISLSDAINLRIVDYIQILRGCQGLFYGSDSITAHDWKVYIENINVTDIYPGIQAIAYATYIPASEKTVLENTIKRSGYPGFKIKSTFKNKYLAPVIYIEPFSGSNLRAFGFDMYSENTRRKALDRAISTGLATMTSKVTLVQETSQNIQPGFLLYLPVYKNHKEVGNALQRQANIKGFVYYPFRAHDLMERISKRFNDLQIKVYDGHKINAANLLFDSDTANTARGKNEKANSRFRKSFTINAAGTPWQVVIISTDRLGSFVEKMQPLLILVFGTTISILFFIMIFNMLKRNSQIRRELELTKELDSKKDEFIGIASHELKTPLTSIKAYMQLLERSDLKDQDRNYVVKANSNIKKLNNLIGDLLDVSKVQSGQLRLNVEAFELKKMISESVENVRHMYSTHKLIIQGSIPEITVHGDILRLEQAMNNLLLNAIKYSPGSDVVHIQAKLINNQIKIEVIDTGIGISTENQGKIFDRFYRAKELSPVLSGLGMGLFISAEIIKRHNGIIGVKSEPGNGSAFYILLPL